MAAIQLVRLANAIPIVTAGTQEKLEATTNAGAAAGFNYKNEDFSEKVLAFTQGKNLWVKDTVKKKCVSSKAYAHTLNFNWEFPPPFQKEACKSSMLPLVLKRLGIQWYQICFTTRELLQVT